MDCAPDKTYGKNAAEADDETPVVGMAARRTCTHNTGPGTEEAGAAQLTGMGALKETDADATATATAAATTTSTNTLPDPTATTATATTSTHTSTPTAQPHNDNIDDSSDDSSDDDAAADYEATRQKNIAERQKMLAQLGLTAMSSAIATHAPQTKKPKPKPKAKKADKQAAADLLPRRRSSRMVAKVTGLDTSQLAAADYAPVDFPAPKVNVPPIGEAFRAINSAASNVVTGFASHDHLWESGKASLLTGHKHHIYSMDVVQVQGRSTLAVAGGKGLLSLYPITDAGTCRKEVSPSLSVKAHSGWIADIQCVTRANAGTSMATPRILSVSNDKSVVLSELGAGDTQSLKPVARLSTLHTAGIFSMHYQNSEFLCCSKDGTVSLGQVTEAGLKQITSFDISSSVLKSVRWQPSKAANSLFACAGNDYSITLLDRRTSQHVSKVEDAHSKVINSLRFSPSNEHEMISSGFDRTIRLWDLRKMSEPRLVMEGHHKGGKPSLTTPIYHNDKILTIGDNSPYLYTYETVNGTLENQTYTGFTPSCIFLYDNDSRLAASDGANSVWVFHDANMF